MAPIEQLCDEILQLIFYELPDPGSLTLASRRLHHFSQDPYVRAHYFLINYGPMEAMFYALGRGKVLTERVLDILLSSGAHLSRYLIQTAIHHYFYTQTHFVKTAWVRTVPLKVFLYFLGRSEEMYGEIPRGKGEDDGSIFMTFLKECKFPEHIKTVTWENIKELLERYRFIPFCGRDPIMAQFPLALAIEPKLLPYAQLNGFSMDYKYRDFVFRKMFERPSITSDVTANDIACNIRELLKLDSTMFVTRTVAAEVCMEAKSNDLGYNALKQLHKSGHLRFSLPSLVEDLLQSFLLTRSIKTIGTGEILQHLYMDFPSTDLVVRLVMLLAVFFGPDNQLSVSAISTKLEALGLTPMTRQDAFNVLINPFTDRPTAVIQFARQRVTSNGRGSMGLNQKEIEELVYDVAIRCLDIGCKGKFLRRLCDNFPSLPDKLHEYIVANYPIALEDLPAWEDGNVPHVQSKLSRDYTYGVGSVYTLDNLIPEEHKAALDLEMNDNQGEEPTAQKALREKLEKEESINSELGAIGQESLSMMIRQDEMAPVRSRRRHQYPFGNIDSPGKLHFPHDCIPVAKWIKSQYGVYSPVTAIFMTHAVVNHNTSILHHYLMHFDIPSNTVPVTLKHFQLMARLGRMPHCYLFSAIERGQEFYADATDYFSRGIINKKRIKEEAESGQVPLPPAAIHPHSPITRGRKRPRRNAAAVSYVIPDSDDEAILEDQDARMLNIKPKLLEESNIQVWIRHLKELLKVENRKCLQKRKRLEQSAAPGEKVRPQRSEFIKSLASNLRGLRRLEAERREKAGLGPGAEDYSDDDEDEYIIRRAGRFQRFRHSTS